MDDPYTQRANHTSTWNTSNKGSTSGMSYSMWETNWNQQRASCQEWASNPRIALQLKTKNPLLESTWNGPVGRTLNQCCCCCTAQQSDGAYNTMTNATAERQSMRHVYEDMLKTASPMRRKPKAHDLALFWVAKLLNPSPPKHEKVN